MHHHYRLPSLRTNTHPLCSDNTLFPALHAGGWLFYLLYAANQTWWFLVICLAVWAFVLVAASFALSGREFLFPVALVSAFMGECM